MTADTKPEAEALLPCPFCNGGETQTREQRMPPTMDGKSSLIGVSIQHWCEGRTKGAQRLNISAHGRNHADAVEAWNTRAALTPKPISVAPDDEALIQKACSAAAALEQGQSLGYGQEEMKRLHAKSDAAEEALRRHIAGLRAERDAYSLAADLNEQVAKSAQADQQAEMRARIAAESALAACRDVLANIEADDDAPECCGNGISGTAYEPPECCNQPLYAIDRAKAAIRALKKDPTNG